MPEGDTIHRLAATMRPQLLGQRITEARMVDIPGAEQLGGHVVEALFAIGKHLLIRAGSGYVLRTHMGMDGSWHAYAHGERWREQEWKARIVLDTEERRFVCFEPAQADVFAWDDREGHPVLSKLGPDLCTEDADLDEVLQSARLPANSGRAIAEVLLDQRVSAGIGNVYKCEVLFLGRVDPWTPAGLLPDEVVADLYGESARLLRLNLTTPRRITAPRFLRHARDRARGAGLWVYKRERLPCRVCRAVIRTRRQGEQQRITWWCPKCQPPHRAS